MKNVYPPIFDLCWCGCGVIVYGGKKYVINHTWIGRKHRDKIKQKMKENHADFSGENHPMYGKHWSKESKNKTSNNKERSNKISESRKNSDICKKLHQSAEYRNKQSKSHIGLQLGKNNPNWKGGISFEPYSYEFNETLKQEIRKRDNYQCQNPNCLCNQLESKILYNAKLSVHHIDYNKDNCSEENLITLCVVCNSKANKNRDYWEEHFTKILKSRDLIKI